MKLKGEDEDVDDVGEDEDVGEVVRDAQGVARTWCVVLRRLHRRACRMSLASVILELPTGASAFLLRYSPPLLRTRSSLRRFALRN